MTTFPTNEKEMMEAIDELKADKAMLVQYGWNTCKIAYMYIHEGTTQFRHDMMRQYPYRTIVEMSNTYNRCTI
jgi:hypothetical protein